MYLISHPVMVLPLLRITQGKKGVGGGGTRAMAGEEEGGQSLEPVVGENKTLRRRLRERERERGNQELYKERWGARVNNKGGGRRCKK